MKVSAVDLTLRALQFSGAKKGGVCTAHAIAKVTGYTPRHINRCLARLYYEGKVAYKVEPHRGASKFVRQWATIKTAKKQPTGFVFPEYIQKEMFEDA